MTRDEIVTALRCCAGDSCEGCPYDEIFAVEDAKCIGETTGYAADLIENQQREIEALKSALHEMAVDFVAMGRIDYWFCDDVPTELHMKHQPKNDGNYENEPCTECVKEYYLQKRVAKSMQEVGQMKDENNGTTYEDTGLTPGDIKELLDMAVSKTNKVLRLEEELHAMKNELCQYCGKYKQAHEGACDGCKWREV